MVKIKTSKCLLLQYAYYNKIVCLYWGFMAQATQSGHIKHGQFT